MDAPCVDLGYAEIESVDGGFYAEETGPLSGVSIRTTEGQSFVFEFGLGASEAARLIRETAERANARKDRGARREATLETEPRSRAGSLRKGGGKSEREI